MTKKFSNEEKIEIAKLFENGMVLSKIAKKYNCSRSPIEKNLIEFLGEQKYKKIGKEHNREASKENLKMSHSLPRSEKQLKAVRENIKRAQEASATLPRSEKQLAANLENIKKAQETCVNGIWISNPEHRFFLMCLSKMFFLKDIKSQFYLKGLNHAFDFAIPSQRLLFEIDGDYWHKDRKERDLEINNFAKNNDWTIFRFNDAKLKELGVI